MDFLKRRRRGGPPPCANGRTSSCMRRLRGEHTAFDGFLLLGAVPLSERRVPQVTPFEPIPNNSRDPVALGSAVEQVLSRYIQVPRVSAQMRRATERLVVNRRQAAPPGPPSSIPVQGRVRTARSRGRARGQRPQESLNSRGTTTSAAILAAFQSPLLWLWKSTALADALPGSLSQLTWISPSCMLRSRSEQRQEE